jgi:hypothetical protein
VYGKRGGVDKSEENEKIEKEWRYDLILKKLWQMVHIFVFWNFPRSQFHYYSYYSTKLYCSFIYLGEVWQVPVDEIKHMLQAP